MFEDNRNNTVKDSYKDYDFYTQFYRSMNIPFQPLPANYSPEEFGRKLMATSLTERGVSYAGSTDYLGSSLKSSDRI